MAVIFSSWVPGKGSPSVVEGTPDVEDVGMGDGRGTCTVASKTAAHCRSIRAASRRRTAIEAGSGGVVMGSPKAEGVYPPSGGGVKLLHPSRRKQFHFLPRNRPSLVHVW